jgi:hypothetical protein
LQANAYLTPVGHAICHRGVHLSSF